MDLTELVDYLDGFLRVREIPDSETALNGLQVEAPGPVTKIGAAVDASAASIEEAVGRGCDFLLVHHGLFWDGNQPVTGRRYARLRKLFAANLAVYAAHLPLDVHPEVGNAAVLARELGIDVRAGFGAYQGIDVGLWGELSLSREALCARLDDLLGGRIRMIPGGPEKVRRVGVLTGSGASYAAAAAEAGLDALITGEGSHHSYFDAMESGVTLYLGGHYATETFGVRALASHLEEKFGLPWEFIDQPTGL